ncbi:MAG: 23S rRNA (guanosine(2251)-2'-O)-methyltransferase RlmB [Bacteroidota bacterium]
MKNQQSLIYGVHPVEEAINANRSIEKIFIQKGFRTDSFKKIVEVAKERNIPIASVPLEMLDRITHGVHQGIAAKVSPIDFVDWRDIVNHIFAQGETPLLLICDSITDVRNVGAIARTAYAAGVHVMIIPSQGFASFTADAVKASAGALQKIHVSRESDLVKAVKEMMGYGIQTIVADAVGTLFPFQVDMKLPTAIIMGSEDEGAEKNILRFSTHIVKLPMPGAIDSYNVSVAAGMMLYEVVRQRMS